MSSTLKGGLCGIILLFLFFILQGVTNIEKKFDTVIANQAILLELAKNNEASISDMFDMLGDLPENTKDDRN